MTEQAKSKEQAILEAAIREFFDKGFDGARTTSIAEAAGVTHAMLHYYFRTKENLFERILDEKMRLMGELVLGALGDPTLPLLDRIREGVSRHFDFVAQNPGLPRFVINEVSSKPERYEMMREKVKPILAVLVGDVQRELNEAADRGEIERVDVRHIMLDILSLNIFPAIAYPIISPIVQDLSEEEFLAQRKAENIETVMRRLQKR